MLLRDYFLVCIRSTRANIETQKNVLQEKVSLATERAESALKAANDKISDLQEVSSGVYTTPHGGTNMYVLFES